MTLDELDEVPEPTAANNTGDAPTLDADPIDDSQSSLIDSLLDEAEKATDPTFERNVAEPVEPAAPAEPAPAVAETPVEPAAPVEEPPKIELDPEIASIEAPRNLSEKNQNNWRKLQETADTYKKQVAELQQQLQQTSQQTVPPDYEELRRFRATFDIQNDPDFKSRYDAPISEATQNIYSILQKVGATEQQISDIKALGGPDKVSQEWWDEVLPKIPLIDRKKLEMNVLNVAELQEKQRKEIEEAAAYPEKFYAEKQHKENEFIQQQYLTIEKTVDEITREIPWARFQQPPPDATPEQLKQIEQHNAVVQDLRDKFESAVAPQTAEDQARVALAATFSHVLTQQLRTEQSARLALEAELKKANAELAQLKSASRMPRTNPGVASNSKPPVTSRIAMSASDAFDLGIEEAGG